MVVGHFGERQDRRRRNQCDPEPGDAEGRGPEQRLLGGPPERCERDAEQSEPGEDTDIVPGREEPQVRIRREARGNEEQAYVAEPDPGLGDEVGQPAPAAVRLAGRAHRCDEQVQNNPQDERGRGREERAPDPWPGAPAHDILERELFLEQQLVREEERREQNRGRLGERAEHDREQVEVETSRPRHVQVKKEGPQDTERGEQLRARRYVVSGLGVAGVDREQGGGEESCPEWPAGVGVGRAEQAQQQQEQTGADGRQEDELCDVERDRVEPTIDEVVQRQRRGHDRPVNGVGLETAEGARVGKETRNVPDVPDVEVLHDEVGVVKMERIAERVRVRGEEQQQRDGIRGRDRPPPRHTRDRRFASWSHSSELSDHSGYSTSVTVAHRRQRR